MSHAICPHAGGRVCVECVEVVEELRRDLATARSDGDSWRRTNAGTAAALDTARAERDAALGALAIAKAALEEIARDHARDRASYRKLARGALQAIAARPPVPPGEPTTCKRCGRSSVYSVLCEHGMCPQCVAVDPCRGTGRTKEGGEHG